MKSLTSLIFGLSEAIYLSLTLIIELKFVEHPGSYLYLHTLFFFVALVTLYYLPLARQSQEKLSKLLFRLLKFTIILFLINCFLRLINIYQFGTLPSLFYLLRLHRFITLSAIFFSKLFLSTGLILILLNKKKQWQKYRLSVMQILFFSCLFFIFFIQVLKAVSSTLEAASLSAQSLKTPFADRFTYANGGASYYGWIWPYTRFIIAHTPENAVIMVPPQSNVWKMEGNISYLRWFIYPRKMVNIGADGTIPTQANFALISQGECDWGSCGWPKISISKNMIKQIIFIDRANFQETIITDKDFEPQIDGFKWGIIELKRE